MTPRLPAAARRGSRGILAFLLILALSAPGPAAAAGPSAVTVGGRAWIPLRTLASAHGLAYAESGAEIVLSSKVTVLRFQPRSRELKYNGTRVWLATGAVSLGSRWAVSQADYDKTIRPLLVPSAALAGRRVRTIQLDPGHGGTDAGAISRRGRQEADLVLDIARRVRAKLVNAGFQVRMTRDSDRTLELDERPARARANGADFFVSIHLNSGPSAISGVETFILTPAGQPSTAGGGGVSSGARAGNRYDAANVQAGHALQRALRRSGVGADRGLKRARFAVLRDAPCPAALVECAFLSHARTADLLDTAAYRDQLAQAIADGIREYANAVKAAQPAPARR